jgi:type II secretory pathway component GspD/PulD (secretin)
VQVIKKSKGMVKMKITNLLLLFITLICLTYRFNAMAGIPIVITGDEPPAKIYKLIPLQSLEFSTVEKVCRPWLSKEGLLIYEKRRSSILVYDQPAVIARIRKFISSTDSPVANIKIELDKVGAGQKSSDKLSYYYKDRPKISYGKHGKVTVKYPKNRLDVHSRRNSSTSNTSSFIVTQSGSPAQLWVGKSVVDPSWRRFQRPNKTIIVNPHSTTVVVMPQEPVMTDVGVSLQVVPRDLGNGLIEVEVYPEISEITGKRRNKAVKVTSLSSKVVVRSGSRVSIGGVINKNRERYVSLFGPNFFRRNEVSEVMNMYLTATIMDPAKGYDRKSWIPRGQ